MLKAVCYTAVFLSLYRVTCVYLACKVEEFNISIQQFVANIKGDREKASDIILNDELLLMQQLNFHLTVHNPYRPITGLLIDIKVCTRLLCAAVCLRKIIFNPKSKFIYFYRIGPGPEPFECSPHYHTLVLEVAFKYFPQGYAYISLYLRFFLQTCCIHF